MSVTVGTRLGSYEIGAQIGVGGMGEVYRATDTRLKRTVAIKVLPALVAMDPDRLSRFEREAEVLASINHPNIAAIFGVEDEGGVKALVMELVEGPTLADRLAHGALALDEALAIARQIADALEAAHEQGIVHRDLKPANIKVRDDGTVKVLDFGLAKATATPGTASSSASLSPTLTTPAMTQMGVILGTAAYMSPEQARGKPVDRRTDIWAFGCVLYEMLSGKRAFTGDDVTDILAKVLEREVDLKALPRTTPPSIARLVRRCFEKDRRRRLSDIGVARLEIDDAQSPHVEERPGAAGPASASSRRERLAWMAAVVAAAAMALGVAYFLRPAVPAPQPVRFDIPVAPMRRASDFAISPDGQRIVFSAVLSDGRDGLFLRELDGGSPVLLAGTESSNAAMLPSWSPNSRSLAFAADGILKRLDIGGGAPLTLATLNGQIGGSAWSKDNVILFASNDHGLRRISASGGDVVNVTERDKALDEIYHDAPVFLPDGRHYLYLAWSASKPESRAIYFGTIDAPGRTRLMTAETNVAYAAGHLLFMRGSTLLARPFDTAAARFTGEPVPITDGVATFVGEMGAFSAADNGTLVYRLSTPEASGRQLMWMDRNGRSNAAAPGAFQITTLRLSPDGTRVAFAEGDPPDLWIYDLTRQVRTRLTTDPMPDHGPVWSPDGLKLLFDSHRAGGGITEGSRIFEKPADGAVPEQPILPGEQGLQYSPRDWSAAAKAMVYARINETGVWNLWSIGTDSGSKAVPYRSGPSNEPEASFSPNGQYLAFTSNESGRNEVMVQPFPDASRGRWQISTDGGVAPRWRRDGRELYYLDPKGRLMAVSVTIDRGFAVQQTSPLIQTPIPLPITAASSSFSYDVTPDGQRFLIAVPQAGAAPAPLAVRLYGLTALTH